MMEYGYVHQVGSRELLIGKQTDLKKTEPEAQVHAASEEELKALVARFRGQEMIVTDISNIYERFIEEENIAKS